MQELRASPLRGFVADAQSEVSALALSCALTVLPALSSPRKSNRPDLYAACVKARRDGGRTEAELREDVPEPVDDPDHSVSGHSMRVAVDAAGRAGSPGRHALEEIVLIG